MYLKDIPIIWEIYYKTLKETVLPDTLSIFCWQWSTFTSLQKLIAELFTCNGIFSDFYLRSFIHFTLLTVMYSVVYVFYITMKTFSCHLCPVDGGSVMLKHKKRKLYMSWHFWVELFGILIALKRSLVMLPFIVEHCQWYSSGSRST